MTKDATRVYVFRRGSQPFETNVTNVAVAGDFYESAKAPEGLEERLSAQESTYAVLMDDLRKGIIDPDRSDLINEFVCNMMARTKHIRDVFSAGGSQLLDSMARAFKDPQAKKNLKRVLLNAMIKDEKFDVLRGKITARQLRKKLAKVFDRSGADLLLMGRVLLEAVRAHLNLDEAAAAGQIKALNQDEPLLKRRTSMSCFFWRLHGASKGSFVLGDVGVIARFPDCSEFKPAIGFGTPSMILLPISSEFVLLGEGTAHAESVDPEEINLASVELSRDFFISSRNTQRELDYAVRIGKRSELVTQAEIDELVRGVITR